MARMIDAMRTVTKLSARVIPLIEIEAKPQEVYDEVLRVIAEADTVDAVEVVHGRWIVKEHSAPYGGYHLFHCSNCDEPNAREKNYCHNCGARMDLEVKDA